MSNELTIVIKNEGEALKKLLSLLEKQYKHVMKKEVFELEALVDEIKLVNKEVAQAEVERRKLVGKRSMREIVNTSNDEELDNSYREINRIILAVKQQKETNELLIRQQMSFDEIKLVNKEVAQAEVERRKLVGKRSMREIVNTSNDEELDNSYREINRIILAVKQQKETNELLIRQQMSFNNQILNIINPRREMKTYNSYGNLSR